MFGCKEGGVQDSCKTVEYLDRYRTVVYKKKPHLILFVLVVKSSQNYWQNVDRLWGMYKRSEPMGRLHSVQKHMANVYLPLQFKEVEMFREHTM